MDNYIEISQVENILTIQDGILQGNGVIESIKTIGQLKNIFAHEDTRLQMDQSLAVYRVQAYFPVDAGTEGGLFFGTTFLNPGKVGNEYFMTQGHFHKQLNRGEYYWCVKGEGVLILMDEQRNCRAENLQPGSLHYIPGYTAHRVANTGNEELVFSACWPSDAGYDYNEILINGFSARLVSIENKPVLLNVSNTMY